ncbi:MAG: diguanylate cyclase [Candidatus Eremiobacteraeota bacterium]|nr:diguanylate cyclase [Candidatus Eremiobacteraeota bacterium]
MADTWHHLAVIFTRCKALGKSGILLFSVALFFVAAVSTAARAEDIGTAQALTMKGSELLKANETPRAIECFEKAQQAAPSFPIPYLLLGDIYKEWLVYDKAIAQYKGFLQLPQKNPEVARYLAEVHKKLAEIYFKKAEDVEKKNPGDASARKLREESLKECEKALKLKFAKDDEKKRKDTYLLMGQNYRGTGSFDKALEVLKQARDIEKDDPLIGLQIGMVYMAKKDYKSAKEQFLAVKQQSGGRADIEKSADKELDTIKNEEMKVFFTYGKYGGAGALVLIILLAILFGRRPKKRAAVQASMDEGMGAPQQEERNSPESVCQMALKKLLQVTQMPKGVVFMPDPEEKRLVPVNSASFGIDRNIDSLELSKVDLREWIREREGKPFIFKLERREVNFIRSFPDSGDILAELEMRIGVPFVAQNRLLGLAYFGCEETKDKLKFKKIFEQNLPLVTKVAGETADLLNELLSKKQAITDTVTGLHNEAYFNEKLPEIVDDARNKGKTCSLIIVEVDGFKEIIETFGEDHGEKLQKMASIAINTALSGTGSILCRLFEARFGIICPDASLEQAVELAEKLKEEIGSVKIARHIPPSKASVGAGTFPSTAIYAEKLVELVTDALEKAKSEGGNQVQVAEKKLRTMETTRMTRDQVLAAVERRRQARKSLKSEGDEETPSELPQEEPAASPPSWRSPLAEPEEAPFEAPRKPQEFAIEVNLEENLLPEGFPADGDDEHEKPFPRPARDALDSLSSPQTLSPGAEQPGIPHRKPWVAPTKPSQEAPPPQRPVKSGLLSSPAEPGRTREPLPIQPKPDAAAGSAKALSPFGKRSPLKANASDNGSPSIAQGMEQAPPPGGPQAGPAVPQRTGWRSGISGGASPSPPPAAGHLSAKAGQKAEASGPLNFSQEMKELDHREPPASEVPAPPLQRAPVPERNKEAPLRPHQPQAHSQAAKPAEQAAGATIDPLTGFFQRQAFEQTLISEAQKLKENPRECTMLYFGIDGFDKVKKESGPVARKLIKDFSDRIRAFAEEGQVVAARIEENGFAFFLPTTPLPGGQSLAGRMQEKLKEAPFADIPYPVTMSIGVSCYPHSVKSFREIVMNSRQAMDRAMKSGGNSIETGR